MKTLNRFLIRLRNLVTDRRSDQFSVPESVDLWHAAINERTIADALIWECGESLALLATAGHSIREPPFCSANGASLLLDSIQRHLYIGVYT
jgi:hypothetical protein